MIDLRALENTRKADITWEKKRDMFIHMRSPVHRGDVFNDMKTHELLSYQVSQRMALDRLIHSTLALSLSQHPDKVSAIQPSACFGLHP